MKVILEESYDTSNLQVNDDNCQMTIPIYPISYERRKMKFIRSNKLFIYK